MLNCRTSFGIFHPLDGNVADYHSTWYHLTLSIDRLSKSGWAVKKKKKNTKMSNIRITPRHIEISLGWKRLGTKTLAWLPIEFAWCPEVLGLPTVQQKMADVQGDDFVGYALNLNHPRGSSSPVPIQKGTTKQHKGLNSRQALFSAFWAW